MTLLSFKSNGIMLSKLDSQVHTLKLQNTGLLSPIILKGQLWFVLQPNNQNYQELDKPMIIFFPLYS